MAVYKVPQDVEAEDQLIGPFGFRQFIYLIIVAFAGFVAYVLSKVFIGLILIPLPFMIFFAALALPLRKDQPTETYLAALLQYYLKPKKRIWMPDGVLSTVEITAPKTVEESRVKDISQEEAAERIERLSQIMDTRGWASRGVFNPNVDSTGNTNLAEGIVAEASEAEDMLDETSFSKLLDKQKGISQKKLQDTMDKARSEPPTVTLQTPKTDEEVEEIPQKPMQKTQPSPSINVQYNPYPKSIHQAVIQPLNEQKNTPTTESWVEKSTSDKEPSPDIMNLVNNSKDLKVSTLAMQANRLEHKEVEEVDVKLH